jgi:hypothetical protein
VPEQVSVSKESTASAETLWSMVSDITRMGEWSPECDGGKWLGDVKSPVTGAKFRGSNHNGKKKWTTTSTVLDADKGKRFSFRVNVGPFSVADWEYAFEQTGNGCRITETWTDRRNQIAKALGKPASGVGDRFAHNRATMEQTLQRLTAAAEVVPS